MACILVIGVNRDSPAESRFRFENLQGGFQYGIGVERNTVDPGLHQELREFRVVAGGLAADADLDAQALCRLDDLSDGALDGLVPSIEQVN